MQNINQNSLNIKKDTAASSATGSRVLRSVASAVAPNSIIAEKDILSNNFNIKIGDRFIHYKTKEIYVVNNFSVLQAPDDTGLDMEICVIYKKEQQDKNKDEQLWARPIKMFLEKVKNEIGEDVERFKKIN